MPSYMVPSFPPRLTLTATKALPRWLASLGSASLLRSCEDVLLPGEMLDFEAHNGRANNHLPKIEQSLKWCLSQCPGWRGAFKLVRPANSSSFFDVVAISTIQPRVTHSHLSSTGGRSELSQPVPYNILASAKT